MAKTRGVSLGENILKTQNVQQTNVVHISIVANWFFTTGIQNFQHDVHSAENSIFFILIYKFAHKKEENIEAPIRSRSTLQNKKKMHLAITCQ